MRCARCGNDNPAINRFCGMCGANLLSASAGDTALPHAATAAPPTSVVQAPATVEPPRPAPPISAPAVHEEVPAISGPSFLGLNQPAPQARTGNLAYLLEDDHPPKSGGAWKMVLILAALALALGFGYLRWRHEGLAWLTSGMRKPDGTSKTAPDGVAPDSSSAAQQPNTADSSTSPVAAPASASQPPAGQPAPATDAAAGTNSAPANPASTTPAANPTTDTVVPPAAASTANPATTVKEAAPVPAANPPADAVDKTPAPEPAPKPRHAPKPAPVKPVDPVTEAERYIYGRGVTQDCDRGLKILRPAAAQSNTQAMISLGGLYSTGQCTPRDLPTAYRWFALALRRQPDNQSLNEDLKKLWVQMTQPERQLAIKLTH